MGGNSNGEHSVLNKKNVRTLIAAAMIVSVAASAVFGSQSFAQQSVNNSTNVIKISPVRTDVQIAPGASKVVQVTITNLTGSSVKVSAIENDFIAGDENGTPALILDADKFAPTHSLKRFMTPIKDVVVPSQDSVTVDVTITVPKSAQAGGYFGAVRFAPVSPDGSSQVNLSPNAASLILLTVPGPTTEKLNLTNFEIQQKGAMGGFFNTSDDITTYIRFENKGNIQEGPFGKITVKNFGKVVYEADFNVNQPRDQILPDAARRWTVPLKDLGAFGNYTVSATLTYGQKNQTVEVERTFWVIPLWAIFAAIGLVIFIIALIVFLVILGKKRRRRATRPHMSRYRR